MKIETKYLGKLEIEENDIISFPKGIPGFEDHMEYVLVESDEIVGFKFLQNIANKHLCFVVVNPWEFIADYEANIEDEKLSKIGIKSVEEDLLEVYNIVTVGSSLEDSTVNLLAPIVINVEARKAQQFILSDIKYTTRDKLFIDDGDNNVNTK